MEIYLFQIHRWYSLTLLKHSDLTPSLKTSSSLTNIYSTAHSSQERVSIQYTCSVILQENTSPWCIVVNTAGENIYGYHGNTRLCNHGNTRLCKHHMALISLWPCRRCKIMNNDCRKHNLFWVYLCIEMFGNCVLIS